MTPRIGMPKTIGRQARRKRVAIVGTLVASLIGGGAALAYWTQGGTGTGTAATGTSTAISVIQTTTVTPMYPGDAAQTISGTFDNPNSGPVYVGQVVASIASVTKANGVTADCDASDYTLADATMLVNAQVPAGNNVGAWTGATIKFNNQAGVNQDGCKGATVNLAFTAS